MDKLELAAVAYAYAEEHYGDKDARFDVIVECMSKAEIAEMFRIDGVTTRAGAIAWAKREAGVQHEKELNQAWDGPESVKSSSRYDPKHDPAGEQFAQDFGCDQLLGGEIE
jgi:hypothetical protein